MIRIGIAGLIGYESACALLKEHKEELESRFSGRFIKDFRNLSKKCISAEEAGYKKEPSCDPYVGSIEEGGLWAALWKACEELKELQVFGRKSEVGCRVFLADIKLKQEIIEIDELYDENPYEAASKGAWLIIWDEDKTEGFPFEVNEIGCLTGDKKRILTDGENSRFLTPPSRQEKDIRDRMSRSLTES